VRRIESIRFTTARDRSGDMALESGLSRLGSVRHQAGGHQFASRARPLGPQLARVFRLAQRLHQRALERTGWHGRMLLATATTPPRHAGTETSSGR
jgi:hypothetical protein